MIAKGINWDANPQPLRQIPEGYATYLDCAVDRVLKMRVDAITAEERRREEAIERCTQSRLDQLTKIRGSRYASCTLANYHITCDAQRDAVDTMRSVITDMTEGKLSNLILCGPPGTGKDHLLAAALNAMVQLNWWLTGVTADEGHADTGRHNMDYLEQRTSGLPAPKIVAWTTGGKLSDALLDAMHAGTKAKPMSAASQADLLCVSDPSGEAGLTPYVATSWAEIIDNRYSGEKPTWLTINGTDRAQMITMLGARAYDRLRDGATFISCDWPSYRKTAAELEQN